MVTVCLEDVRWLYFSFDVSKLTSPHSEIEHWKRLSAEENSCLWSGLFQPMVSYNMLWSLANWVKQGMYCKHCFSTSRTRCCEKFFLLFRFSHTPPSPSPLLMTLNPWWWECWYCFCWSGSYSSFMHNNIHTFLPIATKGIYSVCCFFSHTAMGMFPSSYVKVVKLWQCAFHGIAR